MEYPCPCNEPLSVCRVCYSINYYRYLIDQEEYLSNILDRVEDNITEYEDNMEDCSYCVEEYNELLRDDPYYYTLHTIYDVKNFIDQILEFINKKIKNLKNIL